MNIGEIMNKSDKIVKGMGLIVMFFAVGFNIIVENFLSPDGDIQSIGVKSIVFLGALIILLFGSYIFFRPEKVSAAVVSLNPIELYKSKKKELLLLLFVLLLCFTVLEITVRSIIPEREITKYGWTTPANTTDVVEFDDAPGVTRNITVTYYDFGFKRWGDVTTNKTKVFIVGDSFTAMHFVSNGEEWYGYLEKEFPHVEFFVYGSSGYGSLQEYMVLDDFIRVINPDIILWQFSANDFINNLYEYEKKNFIYANRAFRPYLEEGHIVYKIPLSLSIIREYSYFLNFLLEKWDSFIFSLKYAALEHDKGKIETFPLEQEQALRVTVNIMEMAANRAGKTPMYFFSVSPLSEEEAIFFPELDKQQQMLCQNVNITCIPGVADAVSGKEKEGIIVKVADGHWNVAGNKVAGEFIIQYFLENQILEKKS